MSIEQEMKLVEFEMQVRALTMTITQMRNIVAGAVLDLENCDFDDALCLLRAICPAEEIE